MHKRYKKTYATNHQDDKNIQHTYIPEKIGGLFSVYSYDKFLKYNENICKSPFNKVRDIILGSVRLVLLRLKKSSVLYFYNTTLKVKDMLNNYNNSLIINNMLDV